MDPNFVLVMYAEQCSEENLLETARSVMRDALDEVEGPKELHELIGTRSRHYMVTAPPGSRACFTYHKGAALADLELSLQGELQRELRCSEHQLHTVRLNFQESQH